METHTLEIRPDFEHDPAGARLDRLLAAQRALAHALVRRDFLARATGALAVPLWLRAADLGPYWLGEGALLLFPPLLVGLIVSALAVAWWERKLHDAERGIEIRHGRR